MGKTASAWSRLNAGKKRIVNGIAHAGPGRGVPALPDAPGRVAPRREGTPGVPEPDRELHGEGHPGGQGLTRWIHPNIAHENAVKEFVASLLEDLRPETNRFLADFLPFQGKIAHYGALNSLAQVVLKIAAPGVPDLYQGTELWDFSLVDPDNRRAVDFQCRTRLLNELMNQEHRGLLSLAGELLSSWRDGRVKLYVTYKGLTFRRQRRELFLSGAYLPLPVTGGGRSTRWPSRGGMAVRGRSRPFPGS